MFATMTCRAKKTSGHARTLPVQLGWHYLEQVAFDTHKQVIVAVISE